MKNEHTWEVNGKPEHAVRGIMSNWVFDNPVVEAYDGEKVFMSRKDHCGSCLSEEEDGYKYLDECCCVHADEASSDKNSVD